MEIITPGKLPQEKEHIGQCSNCKCRVKFKQREARPIDDRCATGFAVPCPTRGCGLQIYAWD